MNIYQQLLREYKYITVSGDSWTFPSLLHPEGGEELDSVVDYLDPTEDGETSEETHRSSDEAKLGFQGHLLVLLHFVVGGDVKEDLNEVDLGFICWG